ncbi:uncharacterized protein KQ657_001329 [Scheffersomyces spartinae]|uniref:Uncharacterized protein n=1 Tax=Scheffersomyces spartinae TaxID=45513 RepID=A0A9P7V817_9ASCO|nr:uncharacterized protein KQ657_001329 [Scheffersomyces spartinae]KAG7192872.1 hypothetical protein KQ657_001329 [Scheffersomyces spartinae]
MTTLDNLIRFVDELDSRSLTLVDAVEESSRLISKMMSLTAVANEKDRAIEQMEARVDDNAMFLDLIESLMEKTYLLESTTDNSITTTTSLINLQTEYTYLKTKFTMDNARQDINIDRQSMSSSMSSVPRYSDSKRLSSLYGATDTLNRMLDYQFHSEEQTLSPLAPPQPRPTLSHQISVSNLSLKPLRCSNSSKIDKKKSKYRVSKVYNINPVAYDSVSSVFDDDTSSSIHLTPHKPIYNLPPARRLFSNATDTTLTTTSHNVMLQHNDDYNDNDGGMSEATTTEDISFTYFDNHLNQLKRKSNSLPDIGTTSDPQFGLYIDLQRGPDTRNMRNSRLKHFMSYNQFTVPEDPETVTDLNIESSDHLDAISMVSDFSYYSPDKQHDDVNDAMIFEDDDNFNRFLRKSRVDLNKVLPRPRTQSHDSIFQEPVGITTAVAVPAVAATVGATTAEAATAVTSKFHNPIDTMAMTSKAKRLSPTIEPVYSLVNGVPESTTTTTTTKSLLEKYKSSDDDDINTSPLKHKTSSGSSFQFFNLVSPSKPQPIRAPAPASAYSSSKGQLSLKETISLLVSSSPVASSSLNSTPTKIKHLKEQYRSKTNPIQIRSGSSVKRQPVRNPRTDGAHSLLSIGPNRTTLFTHGDASFFKRPVVTRFNPEALQDALSRSID